jgi:hypothetical protein
MLAGHCPLLTTGRTGVSIPRTAKDMVAATRQVPVVADPEQKHSQKHTTAGIR